MNKKLDKKSLIRIYFQKSDRLSTQNPDYVKTLSSLFQWMIAADSVSDDVTTKLLNLSGTKKATIITKEPIVVAGLEEIVYLLKTHTSLALSTMHKDGEKIANHKLVATIHGNIKEILSYERTILNILQRMSGIATTTYKLVHLINSQPFGRLRNLRASPPPYIAATRKTPWVLLDKKAVSVGGGLTHRLSLSDGILVKDNHLSAIGKVKILDSTIEMVKYAVTTLLSHHNNELIEIEVTNYDEAHAAVSAWSTISISSKGRSAFGGNNYFALLLDNFTPKDAQSTIAKLNKTFDTSRIIFEASGGIDEGNIKEWATTGVDILSLGSLTHSAVASNLSLEIV